MSELSSSIHLVGDEDTLRASLGALLASPRAPHIRRLSIRTRGAVDEGTLWPLVERPLQELRALSLIGAGGRILDALLGAHSKLEALESIGQGPAPSRTGEVRTLILGRAAPGFVRSLRLWQNPTLRRLALRCPSAEISLEPVLDAIEWYAPNLEHLSLTFFGWSPKAGRALRPRALWSQLKTLELSGAVLPPAERASFTRAFSRNFDWSAETPRVALAGLKEQRRSAAWLGDHERTIGYGGLEMRLGELLGISTEEAEQTYARALGALSREKEASDFLAQRGAAHSAEERSEQAIVTAPFHGSKAG